MTTLGRILERLQSVKECGNGWAACCPAHDDRTPSLSIDEGDDGKVLVYCHAGCETTTVVATLGLRMADLFPAKPGPTRFGNCAKPGRPRVNTPIKPIRKFPSLRDAVQALERSRGKCLALWIYRNAGGDPVGAVVRWDTPKGKEILPVALVDGSWHLQAMPQPRPIYRLPEVLKADRVLICEGEKCADAATSLGVVATTSAGGSQAAQKTDWASLAGKQVWIVPDNDPPGQAYAHTVANLCHAVGAREIRLVDLPSLPPKGDIADWIAANATTTPERLRERLETLGRSTPLWSPS
jgi:hypothetical protein